LPAPNDGRHPGVLDEWAIELAAALNLSAVDIDIAEILELAKVAAHTIARPAAPVTAFMVGLAAGRSGGAPDDIRAAIRVATDLATASALAVDR
jgi:hypothetical protein